MQKWTTEFSEGHDLEATLQKLADEGWKIFTILVRQGHSEESGYWSEYTIVAFREML